MRVVSLAARSVIIPMALLALAQISPVAGQSRREDVEFAQIVQLLGVSDKTVVADIGAGGGSWTFRLAQQVGPRGRVLATDVRQEQVNGIRAGARSRRIENVTAILGSQEDTGLPEGCCDAALLRLVYHAFANSQLMCASMGRAVRPGGLLLVIDFRPPIDQMARELRTAGFEQLRTIDRWQGQADVFAVLYRRVPG